MAGLFISFEGGEGTGKSSHTRRLADRLAGEGNDVVLTREPGGSPGAEQIRDLLVTGHPGRWSAEAETLLNYAARDSHLREVIRPALVRGAIVISDRFMDSTRVYQGVAGGCDMTLIDILERYIVGPDRPGLTIVLDIDPAIGLARAKGRGDTSEDRFENKSLGYHRRLRDGFLALAAADPQRCRVDRSNRNAEDVAADIWSAVFPPAKAR